MRFFTHYSALLILALSAGGCSFFQKPSLTLQGVDSPRQFTSTFPQSYFMQNPSGDFEIVLVNQTAPKATNTDPGAPLNTTTRQPVEQVVHVRIFWRPASGIKSDNPAATNAAVRWYILSDTGQGIDFMQYEGAGLVSMSGSDDEMTFTVRHAILEPKLRRGQMSDPIGRATLIGTIEAKRDPAKVEAIIARAKQAASEPDTTQAIVPNSPPPRQPAGP